MIDSLPVQLILSASPYDVFFAGLFIVFTFALVTSGLVNLISRGFNWRENFIRKHLRKSLRDDANTNWGDAILMHPNIVNLDTVTSSQVPPIESFAIAFSEAFVHCVLQTARPEGSFEFEPVNGEQVRVYKSPPVDRTVECFDRWVIAVNGLKNSRVKDMLLAWTFVDQGNMDQVKKNIKIWFDEFFANIDKQYRHRRLRTPLWLMAMVVTFGFNVNAIWIYNYLINDKAATEAISTKAQEVFNDPSFGAKTQHSLFVPEGHIDFTSFERLYDIDKDLSSKPSSTANPSAANSSGTTPNTSVDRPASTSSDTPVLPPTSPSPNPPVANSADSNEAKVAAQKEMDILLFFDAIYKSRMFKAIPIGWSTRMSDYREEQWYDYKALEKLRYDVSTSRDQYKDTLNTDTFYVVRRLPWARNKDSANAVKKANIKTFESKWKEVSGYEIKRKDELNREIAKFRAMRALYGLKAEHFYEDVEQTFDIRGFLWSMLGYLITIVLLKQGSPFWYEIIQKITKGAASAIKK